MLEHRDLKKDLVALGLFALVVFLAAALVSYDAGDPPSKLVYPERAEVLNVCGRSGAMVSRFCSQVSASARTTLCFRWDCWTPCSLRGGH